MSARSKVRLIAGLLAASVVAVGLALAVLINFFGLRFELGGSGMRPIAVFGDEDAHYAALEADRAEQAQQAPPVVPPAAESPEPAAPVPPVPDPVAAGREAPPGAGTAEPPAEAAAVIRAAPWPDFRGPDRDGRYTQTAIRTDWPAEGLPRLWHQPIGGGYASFVVADGLAFTIEQRRDQEVVAAYDVLTGRERWTHGWDAHFQEAMGGPGPRATPTWHDGRLYALGATGRFWCLDAATGTVLWDRDILADAGAGNLQWAMAAAPLVVDDLVVVQPGGRAGWSVVAYDRTTGDVVWHVLDDVQAYTAPMDVTLLGQRQILVVTAERAAGLAPEDGRLLWEHPWRVPNVPNIAQPIVLGDDRVFLSAAYGHGATVVELARAGDRFTAETVWRNNRMKNKFGSSVLLDGYIYGLDEAILACIDAATGELQWKGGRYGYGQLLLAGGHLVVLTERGEVVLVQATPDRHVELASFEAIEGKTWNVPIIVDGVLLVRNAREMAAFDLRPVPSVPVAR